MDHSGIVKRAKEFGLGGDGLVLITFAAVRLGLLIGAVSLLYLIAVVFVSLRAGLVSSIAVSLVAVFLLQYYFVPLFSPPASKNPLAIVASLAFLVTAWVISAMVSRVRKMTEAQVTLKFEERLAETVDAAQRRAQVVRHRIAERLELAIRVVQRALGVLAPRDFPDEQQMTRRQQQQTDGSRAGRVCRRDLIGEPAERHDHE